MYQMMREYTATDKEKKAILSQEIAILGYGSQGRAQGLNLRDSGAKVIVGNRHGKSYESAKNDGFSVLSVSEAVKRADVLAILFPDESAAEIYNTDIAPYLHAGQTLIFAHGFNIHYKFIQPPKNVNVILVAPKGVGPMVRKLYEEGGGVPSLIAVNQDATGNALSIALGYASGIGSSKSAILESSFKDETETDLFGEQAVICGGIPELIMAAYTTLVKAGYPPEIAYSECAHEAKLVIDLIYQGGLTKMHEFVSKTAGYGGITRGKRLIDENTKNEMKKILAEIQSGQFANEWMKERKEGAVNYNKMVDAVKESSLEKTGKHFREILELGSDKNQ